MLARKFILYSFIGYLSLLTACSSHAPVSSEAEIATAENPYAKDRPTVDAAALARFDAANQAVEKQQWQQAEKHLRWLLDSYPELSGPYLDLALLYKATGNTDMASFYFAKAIDVNPNNLAAYNQLGIFMREQGLFEQAEAIYIKSLSIWDAYPETHRNIGVLYDLYLGDQEAALRHYTKYQQLTSGSDKLVAGWIIDLERQLASAAQENR